MSPTQIRRQILDKRKIMEPQINAARPSSKHSLKGFELTLVRFYALLAFVILPLSAVQAAPAIMLPRVYEAGSDVSNWLMSEKLDGVRGYWDGKQLYSKNGMVFHPPLAFTWNFPEFAIEGEIWGGRRTYEKTSGIVRRQTSDNAWFDLKFAIFDVPGAGGGFEERLKVAKAWFEQHPSRYAFVIEHVPVPDAASLKAELQRIERLGGEGLILRKPGSPYTVGRSGDIVKVKSFDDAEAEVIAQVPGKGKHSGRMGALLVELPGSRIRFRIGTGMSDYVRKNPPAIGATITFKYQGLSESGLPKFPTFLRVREVD